MKKFAILMTLMLTMQIVSSQEVVIDTVTKSITLSKEKKIDVAKIILNEGYLFDENAELREYIKSLEEENNQMNIKMKIYDDEIKGLVKKLIESQDRIISNTEDISDICNKAKNSYGLYLKSTFIPEDVGVGFGLSYISNKFIYSASYFPSSKIGVFSAKVFSLGVGFKIF